MARRGGPPPRVEAKKPAITVPPVRSWQGILLVVLFPALVVGLIVYLLFAGGGGTSGSASGIVEGFLRFGADPSATVHSFGSQLPPDFPHDLPAYAGANVVASYVVESSGGTSYLAIYQTRDKPDAVLGYYQGLLGQDPWQIASSRSTLDSVGVQFTRSDNSDVQGDISASTSSTDGRTTIYVAFQDAGALTAATNTGQKFTLPQSKPVPPGFPSNIPLYAGQQPSTVIETYLDRSSGTTFLVSLLTKDDKNAVMDFYKGEFQKRGWTVTDSTDATQGPALSIDFNDNAGPQLQGSVRADAFAQDPSYTRVDILVQPTPPASPAPATSPTPPAAATPSP